MRASLILAAWALAGAALAGQPVTLRADLADADGVVTLGDLFDGAGAAAAAVVATRQGANLLLNAAAVQSAARRSGLDWANAEGLRTVVVRGGPAATAPRGNVDVLTYARPINAGELVGPQDLVWAKAAAGPADAVTAPETIIGMTARRPLRPGAVASLRDVSAPQVIKQGEMITVVYQDGGISLALQAKALSSAGLGETVNIQNLASKKTIQAVATGPALAAVGPSVEGIGRSPASRYAAR